MMMIVLRLLSLLGLKSRWYRHFSLRPLNEVFFQGGKCRDSWTPWLIPLCHRHPTGPRRSGLLWTPWTSAKGDSTKSNLALVTGRPLQPVEGAHDRIGEGGLDDIVVQQGVAQGGELGPARDHAGLPLELVEV